MRVKTLNGYSLEDLDNTIQCIKPVWKSLNSANIFITGGTGFFGQWLLAVLLRAIEKKVVNCQMTVLSRNPKAFSAKCPELADASPVRLVEGDVRNFSYPKGEFTHIIHAATDTSMQAHKDPIGLSDTITYGTRRVLDFAALQGCRRFLFVSSGAVYGPQPEGVDMIPEDFLGSPAVGDTRSTYGQSKRFAEQLVTLYGEQYGMVCSVARCFAFVGPGMPLNTHFAIGNFIADVTEGKQISIEGDGKPVRSYLYMADLAGWLLTILTNGDRSTCYNVGSDESLTMLELAETVKGALAADVKISVASKSSDGWRNLYVPDISRSKEKLGLSVWTGLDEAIRRTADWAKSKKDSKIFEADSQHAELYPQEGERTAGVKKFIFDVDGVVASLTVGNDYSLCSPLESNIQIINRLYEAGHYIVMFTARGTETGIEWREVTEKQFSEWGLKYHELHFGKPAGDYYVDDRMVSLGELKQLSDTLCD